MSSTATSTASQTYTTLDIETVMRRIKAEFVMIAQSTGAITEAQARSYGHDAEVLAKKGYLQSVDATLFSNGVEVTATRYEVNTAAGDLTMSRPGGVMWPRVALPYLRVVLSYSAAYTAQAREAIKPSLEIGWIPCSDDISHSTLSKGGSRDYASNGWGMQRTDYTK